MKLSDLEERLRLIGDADGGYVAKCPACSGSHTLVVRVLRGQALLHCASGCGTAQVLAATGKTSKYAEDVPPLTFEDLDDLEGLPSPESPDPPREDEKARFGAKQVFEVARERYTLGRTYDGLAFAVTNRPGEPRIAREVASLRSGLSKYLVEEKSILVGRETMKAALDTLEAYAEEADVTEVGLRSVEEPGRVVLDLGTPDGSVAVITADGWSVSPPRAEFPIFRRSAATTPLPTPVAGGSLDVLRELLGLGNEDDRWLLLRGWLVAPLFEKRPRPILWALGAQGSGKSTRARTVRNVVDPVGALGREPGKSEKDDTTNAFGRYIPSWDNISTVSTATSDWLCRLVTGVEVTRRALWTNDDLRTSSFRRTGVATSIVLPHGLKADAVERLAVVEFERVPEDARPDGDVALVGVRGRARFDPRRAPGRDLDRPSAPSRGPGRAPSLAAHGRLRRRPPGPGPGAGHGRRLWTLRRLPPQRRGGHGGARARRPDLGRRDARRGHSRRRVGREQ